MCALLRGLLCLLARRHAARSLEACALLAALLAALLGPFLGDLLGPLTSTAPRSLLIRSLLICFRYPATGKPASGIRVWDDTGGLLHCRYLVRQGRYATRVGRRRKHILLLPCRLCIPTHEVHCTHLYLLIWHALFVTGA
jgi:hypothetical protein